ncbi:MAG: 4-hydroxy-tetrahydrodipicolinate synthase [Endozoicomonadaceae bacterium]|nr:4-hydroxy-tetrahydrodipicolinate synthase [Endozoicomonadaceae bacterium]
MFKGSCVALVTPMLHDRSIDWNHLDALIEWHIEEKTDALLAIGTTGENVTLSADEQLKVLKRTMQVVNQRIPVMAGTGSNATAYSIQMTESAKKLGVDYCLLVTPYYNKPTQEGLYQHFTAIANAVSIPQILYNVPGRTSCDLLPNTVKRLANHPHIIAIKEATGDLDRANTLIQYAQSIDHFNIYSGDDATAFEFLKLGGHGVISVTANILPNIVHQLCQAVFNHDLDQAKSMQAILYAFNSLLFVESNPIPVKWALSYMGKIKSYCRLPLTPLSFEYEESIKKALQKAKITL